MEKWQVAVGFVILIAGCAGILLMAAAGIELALRENDEERIEREVERRFNELLDNAQIRVKQQLWIVYGKGWGAGNEQTEREQGDYERRTA